MHIRLGMEADDRRLEAPGLSDLRREDNAAGHYVAAVEQLVALLLPGVVAVQEAGAGQFADLFEARNKITVAGGVVEVGDVQGLGTDIDAVQVVQPADLDTVDIQSGTDGIGFAHGVYLLCQMHPSAECFS